MTIYPVVSKIDSCSPPEARLTTKGVGSQWLVLQVGGPSETPLSRKALRARASVSIDLILRCLFPAIRGCCNVMSGDTQSVSYAVDMRTKGYSGFRRTL